MKEWRDKYRALENKFDKLYDEHKKVTAALYGKNKIILLNSKSETTNDDESNMDVDDDMTNTGQSESNIDADDAMTNTEQRKEKEDDDDRYDSDESSVSQQQQQQQHQVKVVSNKNSNVKQNVLKKGNILISKEFDTPNINSNWPFIHIKRKEAEKKNNNINKNVKVAKNNDRKAMAKPPHLSVYNQKISELSSLVKSNLNHCNFNFSVVNKNLTKIKLNNTYDHEIVVKALKAHNIKFFSFTPKDKKLISTYVKGLPSDFTADEVKKSIDELELNVVVVKIIKLKFNWIFQFHNSSDIEQIKSIKFLLNCRVFLEDIKKTRVIQCKNCQRFNHTASNCNMQYRCIKCSESHAPGACNIPSKEENNQKLTITNAFTGETINRAGVPVFCVNCKKEGHVANSPTCEVRVNLIKKMKEARERKFASSNLSPILSGITNVKPASSFPSKATFASLFSGSGTPLKSTPVNTNLNFGMGSCDIFQDCQKLFGLSFFEVLAKVKEFAIPYSNMQSNQEKALPLLQFLINLNPNVYKT